MSGLASASRLEVRVLGPGARRGQHAAVRRIFRLTLGKLEWTLRQVEATVWRLDGEEPGWACCRILAVDHGGMPLLVEGADRDFEACVSRTFRRAERDLRRRRTRARDRRCDAAP